MILLAGFRGYIESQVSLENNAVSCRFDLYPSNYRLLSTSAKVIMVAPSNLAEPYSSAPSLIGRRCIRVLEINCEIIADDDNKPLQARLSVVDLDTDSDFIALSYVWGRVSEPPKTVMIGNSSLVLTDSCYAAIQTLRRKLSTFSIWIDAVCINQSDMQEKSEQIALWATSISRPSKIMYG